MPDNVVVAKKHIIMIDVDRAEKHGSAIAARFLAALAAKGFRIRSLSGERFELDRTELFEQDTRDTELAPIAAAPPLLPAEAFHPEKVQ